MMLALIHEMDSHSIFKTSGLHDPIGFDINAKDEMIKPKWKREAIHLLLSSI